MVNIIDAERNPNYGGNLINQKYSPLQNVNVAGQRVFYEGIFGNRIQALSNAGLFPKKLKLYANWNPAPPAFPAAAPSPMIVISMKRAWWLKTLFLNMQQKGAVASYNDNHTFSEGPVPWYAPLRSGRELYILVNNVEYDYYVSALKDAGVPPQPFPNVTVVGYEYVADNGGSPLGGFGASRYAAIAMAMHLGYPQAWFVDDNVMHINGFPNVLATVEADLGANIWGIGFKAATTNLAQEDLYNGTVNYAANYNFGAANPGLLQQVTLWNLALLQARPLNMSPYFCTSNEDVSISNYLQRNGLTERVVTTCSIIKISPDESEVGMNRSMKNKKDESARRASRSFNRTAQLFYDQEKAIRILDADTQLFNFISNTVIPHSLLNNNDFKYRQVSESRAIEQTLSAAVAQGWVPARIFNPYNGFVGVQIERIMA